MLRWQKGLAFPACPCCSSTPTSLQPRSFLLLMLDPQNIARTNGLHVPSFAKTVFASLVLSTPPV